MADNVDITAGSGTSISTDDVSGVHYQRVKLIDGTADSTTVIAAGNGTAANSLRVTLANDSTGIVSLTESTASIGKLAANSGVDIGDVDVASIAAGDNNIGNVDIVSVPADPFGANADAASASGSISAKLRFLAATGIAGMTALPTGTNNIGVVNPQGYFATVSTDVTRPADTTAYAANDALSDSTTTPTTGGFTWTGAARASGKSGIITDAIITTANDAGTLLQGEIWIFNQAVTNINDNAAFAVSDAEIKTCVGKIPFTLEDAGNNGFYHAQNLNIGFTCSGSANLRFLVKVKNAYTPSSGEVLTFIAKIVQVD
jgi:hypothetical protein